MRSCYDVLALRIEVWIIAEFWIWAARESVWGIAPYVRMFIKEFEEWIRRIVNNRYMGRIL